jgi:GntR family transcriptional repressor for pyruvate dehydrogenase complex
VHFQTINFEHVYDLRRSLEVKLAGNIAGRITEAQFQKLEANVEECVRLQENGEYALGRRLEIGFHDILTEACDNAILVVVCRFLNDLLRDLVAMRTNHYSEHRNFGQHIICSHQSLLKALRANDRDLVLLEMKKHMCEAEAYMHRLDAQIGHANYSGRKPASLERPSRPTSA